MPMQVSVCTPPHIWGRRLLKSASAVLKFGRQHAASSRLLFVRERLHDCGRFCAILGFATAPTKTAEPTGNRAHGAVVYPCKPKLSWSFGVRGLLAADFYSCAKGFIAVQIPTARLLMDLISHA